MSDVSGYKPPQQSGATNANITVRETGLTDQAKAIGRDLKSKASDLTDTVTRAAKDQASELSTAAQDLAADAVDRVKSATNDQKAAGADFIGNIAQAARRAAGEFESDLPQAAQYIRQAAGQMTSVANAIRDRDMGELFNEAQEFARREPTLFFGGAMVLGFAAVRFFKSSTAAANKTGNGSGDSRNGPGNYSGANRTGPAPSYRPAASSPSSRNGAFPPNRTY